MTTDRIGTTATQYRRWAAELGIQHGSMTSIDCDTIAEAEGYVTDYPADAHQFSTCGHVELPYTTHEDTVARLRAMLTEAGYTQAPDSWWRRDGYRATATYNGHLKYTMIYVYPSESQMALEAGPGGYLHPGDRPSD